MYTCTGYPVFLNIYKKKLLLLPTRHSFNVWDLFTEIGSCARVNVQRSGGGDVRETVAAGGGTFKNISKKHTSKKKTIKKPINNCPSTTQSTRHFNHPPTASKKRTRSHHVVAFDARALGASHMHDVHVRVDRRCAQSGKGSATHWKKKMEIEQQVK